MTTFPFNEVFIHYNQQTGVPDFDQWHNWVDPNDAKMFAACATSWTRHGWNVRRLETKRVNYFHFAKRLATNPLAWQWDAWFDLRELARAKGSFLFCAYDVLNFGFAPLDLAKMISSVEGAPVVCLSSSWEHACLYVPYWFPDFVIEFLYKADQGKVDFPPLEVINDEVLLRFNLHLFNHVLMRDCLISAANAFQATHKLVHYSRSCLRQLLNDYPPYPAFPKLP